MMWIIYILFKISCHLFMCFLSCFISISDFNLEKHIKFSSTLYFSSNFFKKILIIINTILLHHKLTTIKSLQESPYIFSETSIYSTGFWYISLTVSYIPKYYKICHPGVDWCIDINIIVIIEYQIEEILFTCVMLKWSWDETFRVYLYILRIIYTGNWIYCVEKDIQWSYQHYLCMM